LQTSTAHRLHKPVFGCELARFSADSGTATPTSVSTAYDGYGRLKNYTRSTGITNQNFTYNGMDDRIVQAGTGGTVTARYVYDSQGRMLGDYLASVAAADTRGEYIYLTPDVANDNASPYGGDDGMANYGLLAIATKDTANAPVIHYIHSNHLGVPVLTTNSAGTVITVPASTYTQPVFPGQTRTYADLYYNRYRDYDPTTGRYIQADPIGLNGGDNAYLYAMGNPLRYTDPTGKCPWCIILGGAAIIGVWQWWVYSPAGPLYTYNPVKQNCLPPYTGGTKPQFDNGGYQPPPPLFMPWHTFNDPPFFNQKPPKDAEDPNGAKAPGHPGSHPDFVPPKPRQPPWGKSPNGPQKGWNAGDGTVWVPTGPPGAPNSHGGPHWDQQFPNGDYENRFPPK
jgi:RHS repeat-associated protein